MLQDLDLNTLTLLLTRHKYRADIIIDDDQEKQSSVSSIDFELAAATNTTMRRIKGKSQHPKSPVS